MTLPEHFSTGLPTHTHTHSLAVTGTGCIDLDINRIQTEVMYRYWLDTCMTKLTLMLHLLFYNRLLANSFHRPADTQLWLTGPGRSKEISIIGIDTYQYHCKYWNHIDNFVGVSFLQACQFATLWLLFGCCCCYLAIVTSLLKQFFFFKVQCVKFFKKPSI